MFQGVMPAHTQGLPRKPREQKPYTEVNWQKLLLLLYAPCESPFMAWDQPDSHHPAGQPRRPSACDFPSFLGFRELRLISETSFTFLICQSQTRNAADSVHFQKEFIVGQRDGLIPKAPRCFN